MSETISIRALPQEKVLAQTLADYLYKRKKIEKPTISEAMRLSLRFTVGEVIRRIEVERLGGTPQ